MEGLKEVKYSVYLLTNKVNNKKYVGMTSFEDPNDRWKNGKGYKKGQYIRNSIDKHGWDGFEHEVVYSGLTKDDAESKEIDLIAELNLTNRELGYNISHGGSTPMKGRKHTKEARRKLSEAGKGKKWTESQREYMSNLWKGCISPKRIAVICINDGVIYDSITQASEETNAHDSGIGQCCMYKSVSSGTCNVTGEPLIWRYLDDYLENGYVEYAPHHKGFRRVVCLNTGEIFEKINMATETYSLPEGCVWKACNNEARYGGINSVNNERLCWMYYEDYIGATEQEIINKISLAYEKPKRGRSVICITTGEVFKNMTRACEKYDIKRHISDVCNGRRSYCGIHPVSGEKLIWRYSDEYIGNNELLNQEGLIK